MAKSGTVTMIDLNADGTVGTPTEIHVHHHHHHNNSFGHKCEKFVKNNGTGMLVGAAIATPVVASVATTIQKNQWLAYAKKNNI